MEAARADVVLLIVDERARRRVTAGAAEIRIMRKRLCEQRFAAALRLACGVVEPAAGAELEIGQEVDLQDVSHDGVEQRG